MLLTNGQNNRNHAYATNQSLDYYLFLPNYLTVITNSPLQKVDSLVVTSLLSTLDSTTSHDHLFLFLQCRLTSKHHLQMRMLIRMINSLPPINKVKDALLHLSYSFPICQNIKPQNTIQTIRETMAQPTFYVLTSQDTDINHVVNNPMNLALLLKQAFQDVPMRPHECPPYQLWRCWITYGTCTDDSIWKRWRMA